MYVVLHVHVHVAIIKLCVFSVVFACTSTYRYIIIRATNCSDKILPNCSALPVIMYLFHNNNKLDQRTDLSQQLEVHDLIVLFLVVFAAHEVAKHQTADVVIDQVLAAVLRQVAQRAVHAFLEVRANGLLKAKTHTRAS